jgi:RNA polymerase sigma-70 factor (ECF subfamily)
LFRIASNLITDFYRQQGKSPTSIVSEELLSDDPDPFEHVAQADESSRLRVAINALPEEYQDLLIWRFVEDLPHTEIAKITNKSAEALRAMQYRALRALAEQLDRLGKTHNSLWGDHP